MERCRIIRLLLSITFLLVRIEGKLSKEGPEECQCELPTNVTGPAARRQLRQMQQNLTALHTTVESLEANKIFNQMMNISKRASDIEARMGNQTVSATITEILQLKKNIEVLMTLTEQLRASTQTETQRAALVKQIESMLTMVEEMLERRPHQEGSSKLLSDLQSRLNMCSEHKTGFSFPGDNLPTDENYAGWCDTHEVESIGEAYTHGYTPVSAGGWFKDPIPGTAEMKTKVFVKQYYQASSQYQQILAYDNYSDFLEERSQNTELSFHPQGVGFILYNQSFYWSTDGRIYKSDIHSGRVYKMQKISKSDVIYYNHYQNTFVDLKVDEFGLWAIVAKEKNENRLVVSKLDPETLELSDSYMTNKLKVATCATFMICGKLYAIDSCSSRQPVAEHTQYTYDTLTSRDTYEPVHVTSKFGHIYSLNYNPREKILFGWDSRHLVTYSINWKLKPM